MAAEAVVLSTVSRSFFFLGVSGLGLTGKLAASSGAADDRLGLAILGQAPPVCVWG